MALTAQLSQVWRARIESYLNNLPVFLGAITNRNYEGEIKQNATCNIISVGEITVGTYTGAAISAETLATTGITFTADEKDYFAFDVLDTQQLGSFNVLVNDGSKKAAQAMARSVDDFIAGLHTQITTNVLGNDTTPVVVGFDSVAGELLPTQALAELYGKLSDSNADQSSVSVVLPGWYGKALLAELKGRNTLYGDSALSVGTAPGKLNIGGSLEGFANIYISNNVDNTAGAEYKVMAGTPASSITFGMALENVETTRLEANFGTRVKGLNVYGGKIPYEQHMALGTFDKGHWSNGLTL